MSDEQKYEIPEHLRQLIQMRLDASGSYMTVEEYVVALIMEDLEHKILPDPEKPGNN